MATDVNVTNSSVPVDNAAGQTVDVTVSNASIAVTSGSTLDVNITDTSINTRPSTANAASVTVNTSGAITNTELVAPAGGTQLIVTDIIFSNGGTAGDFTLESKNSTARSREMLSLRSTLFNLIVSAINCLYSLISIKIVR